MRASPFKNAQDDALKKAHPAEGWFDSYRQHNNMEIKPGIYKHFKGNLYHVTGIAKHSETQEDMVVYRALYGDYGIWVRPKSMFIEKVENENYKGPRFILVKEL